MINREALLFFVSVILFILPVFPGFFPQDPLPSPTPILESSPTPSPSPSVTPVRTPSPTPLPGAQNFHQWGSVTVFNGLPSDSVRAISQGSDGVMWFGTDNGLARFDGRRIQNYQFGGTEGDRVLTLKTAPSSELWIGTQAGALVYSGNQFHVIRGTENVGITSILIGPEVFLGTDIGTIVRVVGDSLNDLTVENVWATPIQGEDGSPVRISNLLEDNGGLIVATAGQGVFQLKEGKLSDLPSTPNTLVVNASAKSNDGILWTGADAGTGVSGLYRKSGGSPMTRFSISTAKILALETNESGLWIGTERFGLFHVASSKLKRSYTFENTSGGLRSNTIYTLFTDREGVLWIGTNRGVSRFDRLGALQETISDSANSNFIRSLFRTTSGTLFAGSNRGLFKKNGEKWDRVDGFGNNPIYALSEDSTGKLLVGTTERTPHAKENGEVGMWSFADFKREKYAAVNGLGLVRMKSDGYILVHSEVSISSVFGESEKLYLGTTEKGLRSYDGKTVKTELPPDQLGSGTIWRIFSEANGVLWIAGEHGVFRLVGGESEKVINATAVRDVVVDGGRVWAATTTAGLLQARYDERFGWLISAVGFEQGLPSEKAFSILPSVEGLLVATNRGLVTYKPGSVAPKIVATRILSQRTHDLSETGTVIPLDHPQNSILLEVAGQSSRTFPEEFQYAFVLYDSKGQEVDRLVSKESQYAPVGLAPGEYKIDAFAFNRDLLSSDPLTIRFSVGDAPFPWTATALGALLVLALFGLALAFIANRRVSVRNRELATARLDLANEAERERRRIARDLHDQTLADLRSLMLMSDGSNAQIPGFRDEIESISGEVRRICEDLSPSVLENVGLVAALEFLLKRTIQSHEFVASDHLDENLHLSMQVQLQVYRIAQEILTNIKTHSTADFVEMQLDETDEAFVLTIRDNGSAFDAERAEHAGRGIANIRARASMIGATTNWKAGSQGGNRFLLRISK